jgi:hypothetical protein
LVILKRKPRFVGAKRNGLKAPHRLPVNFAHQKSQRVLEGAARTLGPAIGGGITVGHCPADRPAAPPPASAGREARPLEMSSRFHPIATTALLIAVLLTGYVPSYVLQSSSSNAMQFIECRALPQDFTTAFNGDVRSRAGLPAIDTARRIEHHRASPSQSGIRCRYLPS